MVVPRPPGRRAQARMARRAVFHRFGPQATGRRAQAAGSHASRNSTAAKDQASRRVTGPYQDAAKSLIGQITGLDPKNASRAMFVEAMDAASGPRRHGR